MEIQIGGNVSNLATIDSNFISQHARGWNLDRVSPVVVVVAKGIREIENGILRDF